MEIIDKREGLVSFDRLAQSMVFIYEDSYYLKISPIETKTGAIYNAVDLENGDMCIFGENVPVLIVDAVLTVK